ncbi:MAG: TIGR03087 family PEP-CTERM/XrtA system glycosyltransferase [Pirellulales bacterium]|nr:TIGR03087 family PEP-CTERM/XrtA system glycosyltransferase [Pirellulales bacterium]
MMLHETILVAGKAGESRGALRPKILYLTHRVPYPPNRGDRIRSYHTLKYLAERATVDLACLADEPVEDGSIDVLAGLCRRAAIAPLGKLDRWRRALASLARGRSATEGLFYCPQLFRTLAKWSVDTQYDAVLAFCSSMTPYLDAGRLPDMPTFVDLVDVDSQKWFDYAELAHWPKSWLYRLEGRRVRRLEQQLAARSNAVFVVSENEANVLRSFCPNRDIHSIPNGVDLDYFKPSQYKQEPTDPECVFVGALDYRANIDGVTWFCRDVWPQVRAKHPTARLKLVGRCPSDAVRQLAKLPGADVAADVPDVRPYLHSAQVVIAPLRIARGVQNKVLEAFAAAKPVVATSAALVGIPATAGEHVYQADDPAQWLTALSELFAQPARRQQLAAAARRFAAAHYDWSTCLSPLESILSLAPQSCNTADSKLFGRSPISARRLPQPT